MGPPVESSAQVFDQRKIKLDSRDTASMLGQRMREASRTRTDLQDMISRTEAGIVDEFGCDQSAA